MSDSDTDYDRETRVVLAVSLIFNLIMCIQIYHNNQIIDKLKQLNPPTVINHDKTNS